MVVMVMMIVLVMVAVLSPSILSLRIAIVLEV